MLKHCSAIDGLRAIAVTLVVFFHFDLFAVQGGFVGVDVFFVISGFLISAIILNQVEAGKFSISDFYARRAKRILPALTVMIALSAILGWFLLLPPAFQEFGASLGSVATFAANVFYWRTLNYFSLHAETSPLLHCWSLAVEEQFYFLLPILFMVVARLWTGPLRRLRRLQVLVAVLTIFSLAVSEWLLRSGRAQAAFFLLPSRAWELLLGTLLALTPAAIIPKRQWVREFIEILGLTGILVPAVIYSRHTGFPGVAALPPCLGAAVVILMAVGAEESRIGRLLSLRPIVGCGVISYSLYLWHWPIWVFGNYYRLTPHGNTEKSLMIVLTYTVAYVSWRFVEQPFRHSRNKNRKTLFFATASSIGLLAIGLVLYSLDGFPRRFPAEVRDLMAVTESWGDKSHFDLDVEDIRSGRLIHITGTSDHQTKMLVWGDSHAMALFPAFHRVCSALDYSGVGATHSSTLPISGFDQPPSKHGLGRDAAEFAHEILLTISRERIQHVVFAARWTTCDSPECQQALVETMIKVKSLGATPWFLTEVPGAASPVPRTLARCLILGEDAEQYCKSNFNHPLYGTYGDTANALLSRLRRHGVKIVELRTAFWAPDSQTFQIEHDGRALYFDDQHVTEHCASQLIAPLIEREFRKQLHESR